MKYRRTSRCAGGLAVPRIELEAVAKAGIALSPFPPTTGTTVVSSCAFSGFVVTEGLASSSIEFSGLAARPRREIARSAAQRSPRRAARVDIAGAWHGQVPPPIYLEGSAERSPHPCAAASCRAERYATSRHCSRRPFSPSMREGDRTPARRTRGLFPGAPRAAPGSQTVTRRAAAAI
jgi:hypothetical protein